MSLTGVILTADMLIGVTPRLEEFLRGLKESTDAISAQLAPTVRKYASTLESSQASLRSWAVSVMPADLVATGARLLGEALRDVTNAGADLDGVARKAGVSVEALQELRRASEAAGVSTETTDASLQGLFHRMEEAASGDQEAQQAFSGLGVSVLDAQGRLRATDEVLMDVAAGIAQLPSGAQRSAQAVALMGESGRSMVAALAGGAEKLAAARQEARAFGLMSGEAAESAGRISSTLLTLRRVLETVRNQIVGSILPVLDSLLTDFKEWLQANSELIRSGIEQAVTAVGAAMKILAYIVTGLLQGMTDLTAGMGTFGKVLTWLLVIAGALALLFGLKAVLIGALVALVAFLVAELVTALTGGETMIGKLVERLKLMWQEFLGEDIDWEEHPVLAFLQLVAEGVDLALTLSGKLFDLFRQPPKWLQILARGSPALFLAMKAAGALGGSDARYPAQHEAELQEMSFGSFDPNYVSPRATGGDVVVNQSLELNFTPAEGLQPEEIRASVEDGTKDGINRALGMVPVHRGGQSWL